MTHTGNEPPPRLCAECGETFQGRNTRAKYCGQDCNHLAYRKRNRAKLSARSMAYARNRANGLLTGPGKSAGHEADAGTIDSPS